MRDRDSDPPPTGDAHEVRNLLQILVSHVGILRRRVIRGEVLEVLAELEETALALAVATRRQGA
jgi:two-component sensor histidine kinase